MGKAISDESTIFEHIKDGRNSYQNDNALLIAEQLNLNINTEIGVNEIFQIEKYLRLSNYCFQQRTNE